MFSPDEIKKEVAYIFGSQMIVMTEHLANEDAVTIKVTDPQTDTSVTAKIATIVELMCENEEDCRKLLRRYITQMCEVMRRSNPGEERKLLECQSM